LAATLALSLHSSNEPGELSHDDSTIHIISAIIIILTFLISLILNAAHLVSKDSLADGHITNYAQN